MNSAETGPSAERKNEVKTETFYHPGIMPDAWKSRYSALRVGWDKENPYREVLYGIYEDSEGDEKEEALSMELLVDSVEEEFGFTSRRWPDKELEKSPIMADLAKENTELRAHVYLLQDANKQKVTKIDEMTSQITKYQGQIRSLTDSVVELTNRVSDLEKGNIIDEEPGTEDRTVNATGDIAPPRRVIDEPENRTVIAEPTPARTTHAPLRSDRESEVIEEERIEREPDNSQTSRWNRIRQRIGGAILGAQVRVQNGGYRILDRRGRPLYDLDEEEYEEYERSERRAGGVALLGAAAAFGAGVLITWLLLKSGHGHTEVINNGKIPSDQFQSIIGHIDDTKGTVNDAKDAIVEKQNALANQESQHHAQEMGMLRHLNSHLHHLGGVKIGKIDLANFHTDSFYGKTPHQAVHSMFGIIRDNNIQVHGLTSGKIDRITDAMIHNHWHIASGMRSANHQNVVDVAQDWSDGRTSNSNASALQGLRRVNGTSAGGWDRFFHLAARHGVSFNRT
jgi:cell division protein FtsB